MASEKKAVLIVRDAIERMQFRDEYLAILGMLTMAVRLDAMTYKEFDELRKDLKTKYDTL